MFELFFITGSRIKSSQIRFLFRDYQVKIRPQIDYGMPYSEPRISNREELLKLSLEDAYLRLNRGYQVQQFSETGPDFLRNTDVTRRGLIERGLGNDKIFFIEDTSVIISALSSETEVPGVDVKYWMQEMTFEKLDKLLMDKGNDRSVTVRSDVVLYLPPKYREHPNEYLLIFTGFSSGRVIDEEVRFETNALYPWLDNRTFNKWFVPDGFSVPISMLDLDKALSVDFRVRAVRRLITYLSNRKIIKSGTRSALAFSKQRSLFGNRNIILCGPTCAGKTVCAAHLLRSCGFYHIEASDFMHLSRRLAHGLRPEIGIHDFATAALKSDPEIVSRKILEHLDEVGPVDHIITGFRSPLELPVFLERPDDYQFLFVDSPLQIRYGRALNRGRSDTKTSFIEFEGIDRKQNEMGLQLIKELKEFSVVGNDASLKSYLRRMRDLIFLTMPPKRVRYPVDELLSKQGSISLEAAVLMLLYKKRREENIFLSTTEIAREINKSPELVRMFGGRSIATNKNNVSRYFNQLDRPYFQVTDEREVMKYRLSNTGFSRAFMYLSVL